MSEKSKRPRGRPKGSKNKPKPVELSFTRIKELFATCYTPAQQRKRFMALKPDQQFRLMAMLEPKEKPESAGKVTIVLSMDGMPVKTIQGQTVDPPALPDASGENVIDVVPEEKTHLRSALENSQSLGQRTGMPPNFF